MTEPNKLEFPMPDFDAVPTGPPKCVECWTAEVSRFRMACDACVKTRLERERVEDLRAAWATVPEVLRDISFAKLGESDWVTDREAIAAAQALIERPLVTLVGPPRAGKTTLACCMFREHIRRGAKLNATAADIRHARKARFVVAVDLLEEAAGQRRGRGRAFGIDVAYGASVLVLDELGGGRTHDPDGVIYSLIHRRHRERQPTIITTGLSRDELQGVYGGGIVGRVLDDASVIRVRRGA